MSRSRSPHCMRRLVPTLLALTALHATDAAAQVGSGTVAFRFVRYSGPIALTDAANVNHPAQWFPYGTVNGVTPSMDSYYPVQGGAGDLREIRGSRSFFPSGTSSISLVSHQCCGAPPDLENVISFTSRPFTNVHVGEDFVLGTLTFKNGIWFGTADPGVVDRKTYLEFRIVTTSPNGPAFNQTIFGNVVMAVHAVDPALHNTQAGQDAEADWIYVSDVTSTLVHQTAFRVYDQSALPAGYTNVGSVDLIGHFGSLDLVGFANPQGGFLTGSVTALPTPLPPPPPPPVTTPEPATWGLLATGLAGVLARRRTGRG